jgi:hypothetical protein
MKQHITKELTPVCLPAVWGAGSISFVAAGTEVSFSAGEEGLTVWLTACNGNFFRLQEVLEGAAAPAVADAAAASPQLVAA